MRPNRLVAKLAFCAIFIPLAAFAAKPNGGKPATKDPFEAWMEAEDLAHQAKAAEAVALLRSAIETITSLEETAQVTGPGGVRFGKKEALFRYNMQAAETAFFFSYRDAIPFLEAAVAGAPTKELRNQAKFRLSAAKENVTAGVKAAAAFLGDDLDDVASEAEVIKKERHVETAKDRKNEASTSE